MNIINKNKYTFPFDTCEKPTNKFFAQPYSVTINFISTLNTATATAIYLGTSKTVDRALAGNFRISYLDATNTLVNVDLNA